jgi:phosphoribosyl 1,2-cyclic phosphate phosphodiesterase
VRVTLLGTGTSTGVPTLTCTCAVCRSQDPRDRRMRPSAWLEWDQASVLIDTSPDLRQQALTHGIDHLDAVLYTHAHADHILGLDDIRLFNWRRGGPVPVYGSAATLEGLARTFWYVFTDVPEGGSKPAVDRRVVQGAFPLLGRRVTPVPIFHGTQEISGYRIGRFAYLTDASRIPEASYPLLEGLDVLVLNALRPRPHPTHLHLAAALDEAARIGAARTLFTHASHEMPHAAISATLPPGVELAWDGLTFTVDDGGAAS